MKKSLKIAYVFLFLVIALVIVIVAIPSGKGTKEKEKTGYELWQSKNIASWNGSCRPVEQVIKKNLHDPASYEHVSTEVYKSADDSTIYQIETKFRAKNAFNAIVLNSATALVDSTGNVLKINYGQKE